jgi:hypothetical protein
MRVFRARPAERYHGDRVHGMPRERLLDARPIAFNSERAGAHGSVELPSLHVIDLAVMRSDTMLYGFDAWSDLVEPRDLEHGGERFRPGREAS